jgi:adenosylhomocysteine nucleosidase
MSRIAILAAMPGELKPLVKGWACERRGTANVWRKRVDGCEWIAVCAGAGLAAANRAFQASELDGPLDAVVSIGWGGALAEEYSAGESYWCAGVVNAKTGERKSMPQPARVSTNLWLVTSPIVANEVEKRRLAQAYGAALVDMEAFEIARLAELRRIPLYALKGVSDGFHDRLPDLNRFLAANGQMRMLPLVLSALVHPAWWPALMRMGENSKSAARSMAAELLDFLKEGAHLQKGNGDSNDQ